MIGEHFYAFVSTPQHVCETLNFTFVRTDTAIGVQAVEVSPESQNNRNPAGFEECGRWGFRHPCCSGADYPSRQQPGSRSGHGESLAQLNSMLHRSDRLNIAISGNQLSDIVLRNVPILEACRLFAFEVRCLD